VARIAILHAGDPLGFVPSGIDAFVRGILHWSPPDLEYIWLGASSHLEERPLGCEISFDGIHRVATFVPLVSVDAAGRQSLVPLTLRYLFALLRHRHGPWIKSCAVLDFHRPEPVLMFGRDARPKNLVLHQDMAVIRQANSDIRWRHAPALYEALEKRSIRAVNRVYCVRESAVTRYRSAWPDQASKFTYIPTWVDTDVFAPAQSEHERNLVRARIRAELAIPADSILLNFVGRLDRQKNPLLLLEAYAMVHARLPQARLALIGDGALRPRIEKWVRERGLGGQVKLLGALPRERISVMHRAADLFVLSSAYEGLPIALLEALACGLPAVCTDVGEIRRVVRDGENGVLCSTQDPVTLAESMVTSILRLESMRGEPSIRAVREYGPQSVLAGIYDHHRAQVHARSLAC
jgi:glycosyltransferase involved in cell wall biosynthesis